MKKSYYRSKTEKSNGVKVSAHGKYLGGRVAIKPSPVGDNLSIYIAVNHDGVWCDILLFEGTLNDIFKKLESGELVK